MVLVVLVNPAPERYAICRLRSSIFLVMSSGVSAHRDAGV
jgi:hypothetical protein